MTSNKESAQDDRRKWKDAYWQLIGYVHFLRGTRAYEAFWQDRTLGEDAILGAWDHPHRAWLAGQIFALGEFSSVLEIGCGTGANLAILAKTLDATRLVGIDINPEAVEQGNLRLRAERHPGVCLLKGSALNLSSFRDREFDVVFTDATLLYVGPDRIRGVLTEMARVADRALYFLELHRQDLGGRRGRSGIHTRDGWCRNYEGLLAELFPEAAIELTAVPTTVWPTGRWPIYGHGISVRLNRRL